MRISDWSSDVCSSDLNGRETRRRTARRGRYRSRFSAAYGCKSRDSLPWRVKAPFLPWGASFQIGRTHMRDDEFEPRLGRMDGRGKEARYLNKVVKRAEERRVGKEWGSTGRFRGWREN